MIKAVGKGEGLISKKLKRNTNFIQINVILGILNHKFMSDNNVKAYQGEQHTGNTIQDQT